MIHIGMQTTIAQLISYYPQARRVLLKFGIPTSDCGSKYIHSLSIEKAALKYNVNPHTLIMSIEQAVNSPRPPR